MDCLLEKVRFGLASWIAVVSSATTNQRQVMEMPLSPSDLAASIKSKGHLDIDSATWLQAGL